MYSSPITREPMNTYRSKALFACACTAGISALLFGCVSAREPDVKAKPDTGKTDTSKTDTSKSGSGLISHNLPEPKPISSFMLKGVDYLVKAQHESGEEPEESCVALRWAAPRDGGHAG